MPLLRGVVSPGGAGARAPAARRGGGRLAARRCSCVAARPRADGEERDDDDGRAGGLTFALVAVVHLVAVRLLHDLHLALAHRAAWSVTQEGVRGVLGAGSRGASRRGGEGTRHLRRHEVRLVVLLAGLWDVPCGRCEGPAGELCLRVRATRPRLWRFGGSSFGGAARAAPGVGVAHAGALAGRVSEASAPREFCHRTHPNKASTGHISSSRPSLCDRQLDTSMRTAPRGYPESASSPPKPCQNRPLLTQIVSCSDKAHAFSSVG